MSQPPRGFCGGPRTRIAGASSAGGALPAARIADAPASERRLLPRPSARPSPAPAGMWASGEPCLDGALSACVAAAAAA